MPSSRLDCPLSLKTPNMGNTGLEASTELKHTWEVEIRKGMALAEYVEMKESGSLAEINARLEAIREQQALLY